MEEVVVFKKKYEHLLNDNRCHPDIKNLYQSGDVESAAKLASAFIHAWTSDKLPKFTGAQHSFCYVLEKYFEGCDAEKRCPKYNIKAYLKSIEKCIANPDN